MAVPNDVVLRASARWRMPGGQDHVNVFFFRTEFAGTVEESTVFSEVNEYLESIFADLEGHMRTEMTPLDLKVDVVTWQNGRWEVTQNVGLATWGAGLDPSATGDMLPSGVAVLVKLFTGAGKHIGKKFIGGVTEALCDSGGAMTSAAQAAFATAFTKLLTPHAIDASNHLRSGLVSNTGLWYTLTEIGVPIVMAYQRRRRQGTGS